MLLFITQDVHWSFTRVLLKQFCEELGRMFKNASHYIYNFHFYKTSFFYLHNMNYVNTVNHIPLIHWNRYVNVFPYLRTKSFPHTIVPHLFILVAGLFKPSRRVISCSKNNLINETCRNCRYSACTFIFIFYFIQSLYCKNLFLKILTELCVEDWNAPSTNMRCLLIIFQIFRPWTLVPQQIPAETVSADKCCSCVLLFSSIYRTTRIIPLNWL